MSATPQPGDDAVRPSIAVVRGDVGDLPTASPTPASSSSDPEAQPSTPAPPQDLETDIGGGPALPPTDPAEIAAAGGGLADRLRARYQQMSGTEEFAIPGWELPDGSPGLIMVAKAFGDRAAYNKGVSNEAFIAKSTHKLLFVADDGTREEIPGGWGPGLANIIGTNVTRAADLVALVISKPDPDNPTRRIPNVTGIGALASQLLAWAGRTNAQAEEELGE